MKSYIKNHFSIIGVVLLGLSVLGFSDNLFTDINQKSNSDPKFIVHGLFWFAWMITLVVQSSFIRKGNYKAHKKWGVIGMFIAIGVVVSTLYVFVAVYKGWHEMIFYSKANRIFLPTFAVLLFLGYSNRKDKEKHKRYIYLGTLLILEPILHRATDNSLLYIEPLVWVPVIWNGLFFSFFIYDWITLKRIHPITYSVFCWFYIVWAVVIFFL